MEEYFHMLMIQPDEWRYETKTTARVSFCPKGGKMRLYGLLRGQVHIRVYISVCKACGKLGGCLPREFRIWTFY